jgi:hypothetical protein
MIKSLKPAILLILYFMFLQGINAQKRASLTDYITQRFLKYCETIPWEEIYIHTDRDEYIAGEDLWFNTYLFDRQRNIPSSSAGIAYFEILNRENRAVVQKRIKIDKGYGPGHIVLPDSLSPGIYTIRAYTNWMKNFMPENCFMKDITIYNSFSKKPLIARSFINNTPFKTNNYGIISGTADAGLTLDVNNLLPDTLVINISVNNKYLSENDNIVYLFIQTHGFINHISAENITGEKKRISIPKKVLIAGINQITLFNSRGEPLRERYIFTPESEKHAVSVNSEGSTTTREKLALEIAFEKESSTSSDNSNFSISVTPLTNNNKIIELCDFLVFGSEFGMMPWNFLAGRKIMEIPPSVIDSMLLTAKSHWIDWEKIVSNDFTGLKYRPEKEIKYLPGKLVNKNPQMVDSDKIILMSVPGKEAIFQYARTDSEANFSFGVQINDMVKDMVIQPAEPDNNIAVKIESSFAEIWLPYDTIVDSIQKNMPSNIAKWIVNYQVGKIYGTSYTGEPAEEIIVTRKPVRFYGKPDIELIMADYIKLPVMEEVFFELIPGAFLKNKKSGYEITIADPVDNHIYDTPPGLFVDGVLVNDPSVIANLDPELVEKIDVIKEKYFVGDYFFSGIINVITKAGDLSNITLPDHAARISYRVVEPEKIFVSPDYSSAELLKSRIPDFRNTLYWNPSVKPDNDGRARIEFWTSDIQSDYEIILQGVTPGGKPVYYKKIIRVE